MLHLLLGFGVEKFIFGGIVSFSRASTALIILVIPEAPSVWPMFVFTYFQTQISCYSVSFFDAQLTDPRYVPAFPNALAMAVASNGSPTEVPVP